MSDATTRLEIPATPFGRETLAAALLAFVIGVLAIAQPAKAEGVRGGFGGVQGWAASTAITAMLGVSRFMSPMATPLSSSRLIRAATAISLAIASAVTIARSPIIARRRSAIASATDAMTPG